MRFERLPAALALQHFVLVEAAQVAQHRVRHVFDHLLRHARIFEPHERHVPRQRARMRVLEREQRVDAGAEVEDRAQAVARGEEFTRRAPDQRVVGGGRVARLPRAQFGFRQRMRDLVAPRAGFLMRGVEQDLHWVTARAPARRVTGTARRAGRSAPAGVADIGRLLTARRPAHRRPAPVPCEADGKPTFYGLAAHRASVRGASHRPGWPASGWPAQAKAKHKILVRPPGAPRHNRIPSSSKRGQSCAHAANRRGRRGS